MKFHVNLHCVQSIACLRGCLSWLPISACAVDSISLLFIVFCSPMADFFYPFCFFFLLKIGMKTGRFYGLSTATSQIFRMNSFDFVHVNANLLELSSMRTNYVNNRCFLLKKMLHFFVLFSKFSPQQHLLVQLNRIKISVSLFRIKRLKSTRN